MKEKVKLIENVNNFLQSERGYKKSWIRSFIAILFLSIIFGIILGISYNYGPLSGIEAPGILNYVRILALPTNAKLLEVATYMSITGICLMIFPFICGFAIWMIGINQVTKSPFFHLFIWLTILLSALISLICLVLFIRASIFNPHEFPSSDTQAASFVFSLLNMGA